MKNLCFVMATIGVFAATSAQAAGPAFHWGSDERAMSQQECMKGAKFAMGEVGFTVVGEDGMDVAGSGPDVIVLVTCNPSVNGRSSLSSQEVRTASRLNAAAIWYDRSSWVLRAELGSIELGCGAIDTRRGPDKPRPRRLSSRESLGQVAAAVLQREEGLLAWDRREHLVIIPWAFAFGRRLHLEELHVMHHAAVRQNVTAAREEIVDRHFVHFLYHGVAIRTAGRLHRFQILGH